MPVNLLEVSSTKNCFHKSNIDGIFYGFTGVIKLPGKFGEHSKSLSRFKAYVVLK